MIDAELQESKPDRQQSYIICLSWPNLLLALASWKSDLLTGQVNARQSLHLPGEVVDFIILCFPVPGGSSRIPGLSLRMTGSPWQLTVWAGDRGLTGPGRGRARHLGWGCAIHIAFCHISRLLILCIRTVSCARTHTQTQVYVPKPLSGKSMGACQPDADCRHHHTDIL